MHDFLKKPKRHHAKEIPLAPILDLLTVVIFFLILSASFIEMRQDTLPPSSTTVAKGTSVDPNSPPLNPKLIMGMRDNQIILLMKWFGVNPGQEVKILKISQKDYDQQLKKSAFEIVKNFKKIYPVDTHIQLGWQGKIKYQMVLTLINGVSMEVKDLVFLSPEESEILIEKSI